MAESHQIRCITRNDLPGAHGRIARIGGVDSDARRWTVTQQEAIVGIESGMWTFWVSTGSVVVDVVVSRSATGTKYLKTVSDAE